MTLQIGKYKRPGIFIEEIDKSIITSPTVEGLSNLVIGFSKKGPVNTAVLLKTVGDLERIFGSIDRQLERKGSFFHRTISKMLESSPVYAVNLLLTDDALDTIEYQSLSATAQYSNDVERTASYRRFFDTTGFWSRDTESFINLTKGDTGYAQRALSLTNLSDDSETIGISLFILGFFFIIYLSMKDNIFPAVSITMVLYSAISPLVRTSSTSSHLEICTVSTRWAAFTR